MGCVPINRGQVTTDKWGWKYQELKLHAGERKKGRSTKATPFPNSSTDPPLICLDAAQLSRSFVSLAATSPLPEASENGVLQGVPTRTARASVTRASETRM